MMEAWQMHMQMRQYRQNQDLAVLQAALLDVLTEQQGEPRSARLTEAPMRAKADD
jgi:hypothetical protein